jgi:HSP20 family protein
MNLVSWTPFGDTDDLYERLIGRPFSPKGLSLLGSDVQWRPVANVAETAKEYTIKVDLPEVSKKDIDVSVRDGILTIKGERRMEKESEGEKQHRRETFYGTFSRSFTLPEDVDQSKIEAECKDGVLRVELPKTEKAQPRPVEIKVQ